MTDSLNAAPHNAQQAHPNGYNADPTPEIIRKRPFAVATLAPKAGGELDKQPRNPTTGKPAETNDVDTLGTYAEARAAVLSGRAKICGPVLKRDGIACIDLDDAFDPATGEITTGALWVLSLFPGALVTRSVSGTGLHIWIKAKAPRGLTTACANLWTEPNSAGQKVEILIEKFVAERWDVFQPGDILPMQDALNTLYAELKEKPAAGATPSTATHSNGHANGSATGDRKFLLKKLEKFREKMAAAVEGEKHNLRIKLAHTAAGYLHTGHITEADIIDALSVNFGPDKANAEKAILDGIASGREQKLDIPPPQPSLRVGSMLRAGLTESAARGDDDAEANIPAVRVTESIELQDRETVLKCLNDEQYGDGQLFAVIYDGRAVYDHSEKSWYFWNGHYWVKDTIGLVKRLIAGQLAAQYLGHAANLEKEARDADAEKQISLLKLADALTKRAKALRKRTHLESALYFAETLRGIDGTEWDKDPLLLGVKNGVIDLRNGSFRPGRPGDYIRTVAPTEWQGLHARCERFDSFMLEIFADVQEMADFAQRLFGYGITGLSVEHKLPILWGAGRNGKDTLLEALAFTLGQTAGPVSADVIVGDSPRSGSATPHLCDLRGRRIVWASETNEGQKLNAAQVKYITGGGRIKARPMYGHPVEFEQTHLLFLMTNKKPHAPADDFALWKRLLLIPFAIRFVDNPKTESEKKRDPHLKDSLRKEASGILAWLVRGCIEWHKSGLREPKSITEATEKYQTEEDTISQFLADCCEISEGKSVPASALYKAYQEWTGKGGMWRNTFGEKMNERFEKKRGGKGFSYHGVDLLPDLVHSVHSVHSRKQKEPKKIAHEKEVSQKDYTDSTDYTLPETERAAPKVEVDY